MQDDEKKVFRLSNVYCEKWSQLEESFRELNGIDNPSQREYFFKFVSKRLNLTVEEYKNLYEIYNKPEKKTGFWSKAKNWIFKNVGIEGKTLWDYTQLLVIPILLVVIPQQIAEQISSDRARQETLNKYFDELASLLRSNLKGTGIVDISKMSNDKKEEIDKKNSEIQLNAKELQVIGRAKTLTTLRALDSPRKTLLLVFLKEANLIEAKTPIIKLSGVDLSGADLRGVQLDSVNLAGVNLSHANLSGASFCNTDFRKANLSHTKLQGAKLFQSLFDGSDLKNSNFQNSILIKAEFNKTRVDNANFNNAILSHNIVYETDFTKAYGANLINVNEKKISSLYREMQLGIPTNRSYTENFGCPMPVFSGPGFDYRIIGSIMLDETVIETYGDVIDRYGYEWQRVDAGTWIPSDLYD